MAVLCRHKRSQARCTHPCGPVCAFHSLGQQPAPLLALILPGPAPGHTGTGTGTGTCARPCWPRLIWGLTNDRRGCSTGPGFTACRSLLPARHAFQGSHASVTHLQTMLPQTAKPSAALPGKPDIDFWQILWKAV